MFRHGNYFGAGLSAGRDDWNDNGRIFDYEQYTKEVASVQSIDNLDEIAKHHDIGLGLARIVGSNVEAETVNWNSGKMFWHHGGLKGRVAGVFLMIGSVTRLGNYYMGKPVIVNSSIVVDLEITMMKCDVEINRREKESLVCG